MKKITLLIVSLIHFGLSFGQQQNKKIDTSLISFKAKLLTVSEYGISSKKQILKDIEEQKLTFLKTKYKNFIFIKIDFSQPYWISENSTLTLKRNCSYYLAYNLGTFRYYKLGGFSSLDVDAFFNDLLLSESSIFKGTNNEIEEMDIHCLYNYYKLKKRRRFKKGFNCFDNCSEKTETEVIQH